MFIDSHIHVGQFYDIYTTPTELIQFLDSVGVVRFAVSSTTICEGNYEKVIAEMKELIAIGNDRVIPVLWIVPQMLEDGGIEKFMDSGISWKCVKIHPQLHPTEWTDEKKCLNAVCAFSTTIQAPLLIHTGDKQGCYPSLFENAIKSKPMLRFILAHGRPVDEAIALMEKYENVWVDTAFMPITNIVKCCQAGFVDRILWGSDYPIPKYYYRGQDMKAYYTNLIKELRNSISAKDYLKITETNAERLFVND